MSCVGDAEIHRGALAPYALFYTVTSTAASFDLTTVTSASYDVKHESGATDSWAATLEAGATALSLTIKHIFVAGDVDDLGTITVVPRLVTPGGDILAEPRTLLVKSQYDS